MKYLRHCITLGLALCASAVIAQDPPAPNSRLVIIKGVEWFVKNTPSNLHVLHQFLKPEEVTSMCHQHGMTSVQITGSRPKLGPSFWKLLWTGTVSEDFEFTFSGSSRLGFTGVAQRRARETP